MYLKLGDPAVHMYRGEGYGVLVVLALSYSGMLTNAPSDFSTCRQQHGTSSQEPPANADINWAPVEGFWGQG